MRPAPDPPAADSFAPDAPTFARAGAVLQLDRNLVASDITLLVSVSFVVARLAPVVIAARALIANTDAAQDASPTLFLVAGPPAQVIDPNHAAGFSPGTTQIASDGNGTVKASTAAPRPLPAVYAPLVTGQLGIALWALRPGAGAVLIARGEQQPLIGSPVYGSLNGWPTSLEVHYPST